MATITNYFSQKAASIWNSPGLGMRSKLVIIFLFVKVIPLILLAAIAWRQFTIQGDELREIAVGDSAAALNDSAVENIERMSTYLAQQVADFLYDRDYDILYLASLTPSAETYRRFLNERRGRIIKTGRWILAPDGEAWVDLELPVINVVGGLSTNNENEDMNAFRHRPAENFKFVSLPLYDEITFVDPGGMELIKVIASDSPKVNYPLSPEKKDISRGVETYVKAETYFQPLQGLKPGEIYVSDVIGAYVGSNYIGMYTPPNLAEAAVSRGYAIDYQPDKQAYASRENPHGRRFEGLIRWASPVAGPDGEIIGYVTMALNHDHIMEFVDHITPMNDRYTSMTSADGGNYAFIRDYLSRTISHPRHHSIVGFDPLTGDRQIPWLESSIYEGWQASGLVKWTDYVKDYPVFFEQSRAKELAPELTRLGLVGLDGRYLNNAPQCTGWMDLTSDGGSGSFYISWSGLYMLTTAAAIPYYTGQYAPSEANGFSRRGFGFVAIGSGLESFTRPARATEEKLAWAVAENLKGTFMQLSGITAVLIILVVFVAIWMASVLTSHITGLIRGISRFRSGERQFRFNAPVKDEFGILADSFDDMADSIDESVKNPLSITDMDQKIIYMNKYGLEHCGKILSEVVGTPYGLSSVYPVNSRFDPIAALEEGLEADIFYVDARHRYIRGVANYFLNNTGERIGYIIETIDMTEMVCRQLALEKAMNDAKRANEHKGEFLARMSHEIRTPMNAIIGLASIVQRDLTAATGYNPELAEVNDYARQIEASSLHLLSLINDILDISKIEAGKLTLNDEAVDLSEIIRAVVSMIQPRCDEKNITFSIIHEDFEPATFLTDPLRLRQVLINLLSNAVKFTPELGQVELHIIKKYRQGGRTLIEFRVCDTGIGISGALLSSIFQPFEQAGATITRKYGGTGLGLTISQHIVRMFGGDIEVRSRLGTGSEFSFSVWFRETESQAKIDKERPNLAGHLAGKRILLVDDVELNRKVAKAMLKATGLVIDEAEDGVTALKKFENSPEYSYDLILMDVLMPNLDGYQACQAIRSLNRPDACWVPIIALTANAFNDDVNRALEAGMNAHIAKPVKMERLMEVLFEHLSPQ